MRHASLRSLSPSSTGFKSSLLGRGASGKSELSRIPLKSWLNSPRVDLLQRPPPHTPADARPAARHSPTAFEPFDRLQDRQAVARLTKALEPPRLSGRI